MIKLALHTFHTQTLKVRSAVVVFHEGRLLLMRQNSKPFWVLPGGTLEEGESIAICAVRELDEEVGMTVSLVGMLTVSEFADAKRHVVDVTFLGTYEAGATSWEAPYPENIDDVAWVDEAEFKALSLKPDCLQSMIAQEWDALSEGRLPVLKDVYLGLTS
ncbi:MAG: NUDIX hydrolase [Vampirovibrionales bacterium]|jgi:ADP-ribose pyrophosphatase YjhB (NUDIX family)|nr:NUDIX hydrolase [Vampirovibrionales bacterium]